MRRVSTTGAVALLALAPAAASATSLARCETYDTSGLAAPWSSPKLSQPDDETRWSVESGRLVRQSVRGSEERELADERLLSVAFPTSREGWTVGESGVVFHTGDGGRHWERRPIGQERDLRLVRCADAARCAIVAADGTLLQTTDGGRKWTPAPFRVPSDVKDMHLLDVEHGWMVSESGAFLETHDGGVTWSRRATEHALGRPDASIEVVRFADPQLGWIASGNRLLRTTDGGESWEVVLRLEDGLSFFAVASPDGRQVQAGVGGDCHDFERSGGNYRSEDGGATWEDVVGPEESEANWEALVRDSSTKLHLTHAFRTSVLDRQPTAFRAEVVEARPDADGLRVRHVLVRQHPCGDVEVASREEPAWPAWEAFDPCGLDAERANEVLGRFAFLPASDETRLLVTCGEEQKTFRLPQSIPRRQLARVSSSLLALMGLADRMRTATWSQATDGQRNAGARDVPLLKSGRFDAGFERPATLRDLLARYEGPLPPKGALGRVEVELPAGASLRQDVRPPYPEIALQARVEGRVVLDLVVDAQGAVQDVERVAGIPLLDDASLKAVRQWRFEPGTTTNPVRVSLGFVIDPCARGGRVVSFE